MSAPLLMTWTCDDPNCLPHQILAAIEMLTALATEPNVHLGLLDLSANTFATYADGAHAP
jgi:hypothetical protein